MPRAWFACHVAGNPPGPGRRVRPRTPRPPPDAGRGGRRRAGAPAVRHHGAILGPVNAGRRSGAPGSRNPEGRRTAIAREGRVRMGYQIVDVDLCRPLPEVRLRPDQTGIGLDGSQLALGWLRLSQFARYVPYPFIAGFMCGIAVLVLESAMPLLRDEGSLTISVEQMEGAAWSAIIHEARGLAYFQHNNGTLCGFYSLVDCDAERLNGIRVINERITALAPVLNTQSYQHNFNSTTDTMLKAYGGSAYIFSSIGLGQSPGSKSFTLPGRVTGSTVEVVGENRTLAVVDGAFTDTFASEFSHHIYKVAL